VPVVILHYLEKIQKEFSFQIINSNNVLIETGIENCI
jgi:hypothetical protein